SGRLPWRSAPRRAGAGIASVAASAQSPARRGGQHRRRRPRSLCDGTGWSDSLAWPSLPPSGALRIVADWGSPGRLVDRSLLRGAYEVKARFDHSTTRHALTGPLLGGPPTRTPSRRRRAHADRGSRPPRSPAARSARRRAPSCCRPAAIRWAERSLDNRQRAAKRGLRVGERVLLDVPLAEPGQAVGSVEVASEDRSSHWR